MSTNPLSWAILLALFLAVQTGCSDDDGGSPVVGDDDDGDDDDDQTDPGSDDDTTDIDPGLCNFITHEMDKGMTGSIGTAEWTATLGSADVGESVLAYWKYGKQTTLTVTFDDSTQGQANYAVPALKQSGIVGTFFVNPGGSAFAAESAIWDEAFLTNGQEIANHTWGHDGGENEAESQAAVDLASEYIKEQVYGIPPTEYKILAFNRAGGSNWHLDTDSEDWNMFIRGNYLFERKYSSGMNPGTTSAQMSDFVLSAFQGGGQFETTGGSMHFHGICNEANHPGCDNESVEFPTNNGAVQKGEIENFFQWLVDPLAFPANNIWIAGYAEYRKYMVVRSGTTVSLEGLTGSGDDTVIDVELSFDMPSVQEVEPVQYTTTYGLTWGDGEEMADPALYACEPVTVFTKVPGAWTAARVTLETGESHVYRVNNDEVRYEAFTDSIVNIEYADEADVDIHYVGIP